MNVSGALFFVTVWLALSPTQAALADTLNLPAGAVIVRSGNSLRPPSASERPRNLQIGNEAWATDADGATSSTLALPRGAVVLYAGRRAPWVNPTAQNDPRSPPPEIAAAIAASALRHGVSASLVKAVAWQESRYDHARVSPKGARGIMQLMPATALWLQVDERDMRGNIDGGVAYLAKLLHRFSGNLPLALAAYNAGPGAVDRHGGIPPYPETQAYVRAILARLGNSLN